jgi:DNA primase/DNA-binding transcriptional ArsR family regulator
MNIIEEIKKRINIVDLANDFGLQPTKKDFIYSIYKEEKNRSLKLFPETNSFYDFSTGKGGDVINFYADFKKIDNKEAIVLLSEELGIDSVFNNFKIERLKDCNIDNQKKNLEIYTDFEKYCGGIDERAFEYLIGPKRGLTEDSIKRFRLFSIKDLNGTIDFLLNSFHLDELKASGLFNETGRFVFIKHRLIIPYLEDDKIVYMRGRVMPEYENNDIGKYIGLSGQTAKRFFNENRITKIKEGDEILICEGEFDTIIADQNGSPATGIPGVHNFPQNGKELLEKPDVHICFDNDEAGKKGMQEITNKIGKDIKGVYLKNHKDLSEYFNNGGSNDLLYDENVEVKVIKAEIKKKSSLKLISAYELMKKSMPELLWLVDELLPEGLIILAGRPKIGKSFLAMNIAIAVANGGKALGYFNTNKNSVVYIALEDNERRLRDRMSNILQAEFETEAPKNLFYLEENYNFPKLNQGGIEELKKIILDDPSIKLIIIDTLGRSIADKSRKDKDMYRADYDISSSLQGMALKNNICLLVLHHTKKGSEENVFDEISGTTGLTGAMDTMMVLKKKNNKYTLHVTGRDVQEAEYEVEFNEDNFTWNYCDKKNEHNLTTERQEIVDLIKKYGRKMKTGEIAELLGKSKSNISKMLKKLMDDGILHSEKYGVYELVNDEEEKS